MKELPTKEKRSRPQLRLIKGGKFNERDEAPKEANQVSLDDAINLIAKSGLKDEEIIVILSKLGVKASKPLCVYTHTTTKRLEAYLKYGIDIGAKK